MSKKKILFISNHAAFFVSHRINIFEESKKNNYNFYLIFGRAASSQMENLSIKKIKKKKIIFSKFKYSNNSFSFINDFWSLIKIVAIIRKYKPNIIHSASPKANIYAGILAKFFYNIGLVISFSGMGYLYTEKKYSLSLIIKKFLFDKLLSFIFSKKKKKIIVQNNHDYLLLKKKFNLSKKNLIHITGGSGVNIKKFSQIKRKKTKNIVMVSRILKNKGVIEFFKASQLLKLKYPDWKFKMIGSSDYNSPDKISRETIEYYQKKKIIIFEGYKKDISKILSKTEIFCLPSYREGMPKSTLEALAAGVPVVTSDAVGCKESILPKKNGLLCKKKNYKSLANQIEKLISQPEMRKKFSINAKNYAKRNFSISDVSKKIYNVYDELNYE